MPESLLPVRPESNQDSDRVTEIRRGSMPNVVAKTGANNRELFGEDSAAARKRTLRKHISLCCCMWEKGRTRESILENIRPLA